MGLQNDIQTQLAAAFDTTLSDAVASVVFVDTSTSSYNPVTGDVTLVELRYPTRAVISPYSEKDIGNSGGKITNRDLKVILLSNEIDAPPVTGMKMEIVGQTEIYSVEESESDPAGASYEVQVRS